MADGPPQVRRSFTSYRHLASASPLTNASRDRAGPLAGVLDQVPEKPRQKTRGERVKTRDGQVISSATVSTMTTAQRGTPAVNLAPTQNQNTAPVFEFECLFTHDLRKKKRTWHDGSLRFHTFNRRVMVYDDSKNFIGDLHYRDADEIQEGEELRLDKGVLVDVGRRTGQTETDLAEVLDKRRHGEEGAQTRHATPATTYQSKQTVLSANRQERSKSLAAVLGASQGPIGRARLAIKSPYELLHSAHPESIVEQPPAKKQRLAVDKENMPNFAKTVRAEQQYERRSPPSFPPSLPRAPLVARKEIYTKEAVIDISSEDEESLSPMFSSAVESNRSRRRGTKAMRNPPAKLDLAPKPSRPKQNALPKLLSVVEPPMLTSNSQAKQKSAMRQALTIQSAKVSSKAQGKQAAPAQPAPVQDSANVSSKASTKHKMPMRSDGTVNLPSLSERALGKQKDAALPGVSARRTRLHSGPTSSLRFAPQKPRPKLIYKDLLPTSFIPNQFASGQADAPVDLTTRSENPPQTSSLQFRPEKDVWELASLESIPSHQRQRAPTPAKSPPRQTTISPMIQASSSMFVSQSPSNVGPDAVIVQGDSPVPSPIQTPPPSERSQNERLLNDELFDDSPISAEEPNAAPSVLSVSKLTLMDQRLMVPPPRIEQPPLQSGWPRPPLQKSSYQVQQPELQPKLSISLPAKPPQARPFRRVLSESDSPAHETTRQIVSPPAGIPSALNSMQQRSKAPAPGPQRPFKSPTKLQRSYSDTATMLQIEMQRPIGRSNVNVPDAVHEEENSDSGPWSSREAFLLFDWWPPGCEKPDYGAGVELHEEKQQQQQSFSGFTHPRNAESFGQLHIVIRDGIDI